MTKLRIMSDLHLEFGPLDLEPIGEDVLVLAGDVGLGIDGALWAAGYGRKNGVEVVMIAGNHEHYQQRSVRATLTALRDVSGITFLEDDIAEVVGCVFIGATLWTDFNLNGCPAQAQRLAESSMNDYRLIHKDGRRLTPIDTAAWHKFSVGVLRERLPRRYQDGKPVVVLTHHLPSARSIAGRYADSEINAAYASNLDDIVAESGAALWVHGHTHVSQDYMIGNTRVLCNPRGYAGYEVNPKFNPDLMAEV